jgi:hypothetical protein
MCEVQGAAHRKNCSKKSNFPPTNIGTTQKTMGVTDRIRWNGVLGRLGGLVKYAAEKKVTPRVVREDKGLFEGFQGFLVKEEVELERGNNAGTDRCCDKCLRDFLRCAAPVGSLWLDVFFYRSGGYKSFGALHLFRK